MHREAARHKAAIRQLLQETCEAAGAAEPHELASQLMVLVEGAITMRQVASDDQAAATARRVAGLVLDQALADG